MWKRLASVHLRIIGVCAAGILAWGTASAPAPQASPLPEPEFWKRVEATLSVVQGLDPSDSAAVTAALTQEADAWTGITAVELADGSVVPIDTEGLVDELRAEDPDLDLIEKNLQKLLDARDDWPPAAMDGQDGANAKTELERILSAEEFQWREAAKSPLQEFVDQLWNRFLSWVQSLFPSGSVINLGWMRWIIILTGLLVLTAALIYTARRISGGMVDEDALGMNGEDGGEIVTADSAFRRAKETSQDGDYRSAVRWLYLSSLLTLEERGLLRYDRTRTNREYLRSVSSSPELARSLRDIVEVFDRVWYGFQPIDGPTFDAYVKHVSELRRMR